jgi:3-methylcrotonyl-CoA carboxylase alpha subunit
MLTPMLKKVLIANRGEIACRIIRTARRMGIATVAVYADADAKALHVKAADEAVHIGASPATESYLRIDKIIASAKATGADAIHPGYGFLSENPELSEACKAAGIIFIGPSAAAMRALGGKAAAKDLAIKAGVPVVPGYQGKAQDLKTLTAEAKKIGYPVMIKAVAGGGGRGMRLVESDADFSAMLESAKREALSAFGNDHMLLEKVVVKPRHIEVQVFGDSHGRVVHLFERDCSLQRRNQKVIEEAPAPGMSQALREMMCAAAVGLSKSVGYEGAGTVEFLVEGGKLTADAPWYFIEMNTRLQVEHPVTEEITGLDLVEWQFRVAAGETLPLSQDKITMSGHAIEVRLCAEDPANGFMPSVGKIAKFGYDDDNKTDMIGVRLESGVEAGDRISPYYDSMIAKIIATAPERHDAITLIRDGLQEHFVTGLKTNAEFLDRLLLNPDFAAGIMDTALIARNIKSLSDFDIAHVDREIALEMFLRQRSLTSRRLASGDTLDSTPWGVLDAFSLAPNRVEHVSFSIDGVKTEFPVEWMGDRIKPSFAQGALRTLAVPKLGTTYENQRRIHSLCGLVSVEFAWPTYDASFIDDASGTGAVRAPINGRVAKLMVKIGDKVAKGDTIAIVEAMKMEHLLTAAISGTIDKLGATEGAQVNQGALIATIGEW